MHVVYTTGKYTKFLIKEMFEMLEDIRKEYQATIASWDGSRRFNELMYVLRGDVCTHYDVIMTRNCPNPPNKTNSNYEELRRKLITVMSEHVYPGEKVCTYLNKNTSNI